ncbi:MAG TPA: class F sortase [Pseudonocardia sp.]|jgi:hypothetical protein|nr:class F sortase [Pseudonocardia sp.]
MRGGRGVGRWRRTSFGAASIALAVALGGCGSAPVSMAVAGPPGTPATVSSSLFLPRSEPVRVIIPTLQVKARLIELGLRPDRTMEVPTSAAAAGWYSGSPTPGELGPAVITAHVSWQGTPGVFADLKTLDNGDQIGVRRADGSLALFEVLRVEQYAKSRFPTEEVYGDIQYAGLRLITCGGDVEPETGEYPDNVVVYAGLVGTL